MKIHQLSAEEAFASVHSTPGGLSTTEALRRLAEYGPNHVQQLRGAPPVLRLLRQFSHFFALILWVAAALAFFAEWRNPNQGMGTLGIAVVGVIVVNGLFSFWQEYRAERAVAALQDLLPHHVQVCRDGKVQQVEASQLVPGDLVLLAEGESVPADCRLVEALSVRVNNATITGESAALARDAAASDRHDLLEAQNIVLAGTSVVSGHGKALVYATGMHTQFGEIAILTQAVEEPLSPLQKEIVRLSRVVALLAGAIGLVFFAVGQMLHFPFWANFVFVIGIIVANVPEGLLPTVTLSLAMASQRMARRDALVRHLPAVEALGAATVICTDKTGTLTLNEMKVRSAFVAGRHVDPDALAPGASGDPTYRPFFETAAYCENVKEVQSGRRQVLRGDPMEVAIAEFGRRGLPPGATVAPERVEEVPFDTDRKRLSTLCRDGDRLALYTKGAPETVVPLCDRVLAEGGAVEALDGPKRKKVGDAVDAMTGHGLRVLALAWRPVNAPCASESLERDLVLCGLVGLEDPPRPEVPAAVRKCQEAGVRVIMVTGDHPHTAEAIARQVGLVPDGNPQPRVITGEHLRRMSNIQLQLALDAPHLLFARVSADQKMRIVRALRRKGHVVAATGDGVNDAPALREADIGVAMGRSGTDVAREAADLVLLDDNFASIVSAIEEGRAVFANIRKFLTYILSSNVPELVPYLAFVLFRIPLPLTVMQILAVDLGTDLVPALALGAEPPDPDAMRVPPRPRRERLLTAAVLLRSYLWLGVMESAAAMAAFFFVLTRGGWRYGQSLPASDGTYLQATTASLTAIVLMQVVNVFLCRSERGSVFGPGLSRPKFILAGVATELTAIFLINYTSLGQSIFGTCPLGPAVWLYIVPFAAGMLLLEESRKLIARRLTAAATGRDLGSDAKPGPPPVADAAPATPSTLRPT